MSPAKKDDKKEMLRDSLRQQLIQDASAEPGTPAEAPAGRSAKPKAARSRATDGLHIPRVREALAAPISFGTPGLTQMAAFCRQLATLIDVGIPLLRSLNVLAQRIEHPKLRSVVADIARRVEEGTTFSQALAAHPKVFAPLVVNVVRIGETGGILERSLNQLAEIMERRSEIRKKVASAAAYPIAALIVCGLVLLVILGFAIPVFKKIYESVPQEIQLPAVTRFILGLSDFTKSFWWLIILAVVAIVLGIKWMLRMSPGMRRAWDLMKLKLPVIGRLSTQIGVTRSCRTLGNLLKAGVPLLESLRVAADTSENIIIGDALKKAHNSVEAGGQMEPALRQAKVFPDLVVDMIAIGDEAGRLDVMFTRIADTYEEDVNLTIRTLNAILEPALILIMGTIVLVLALSVLLPYWKIGAAVAAGSE